MVDFTLFVTKWGGDLWIFFTFLLILKDLKKL